MHMHVQGLASEPGGEDKLRAFYHDVRRLDRLPEPWPWVLAAAGEVCGTRGGEGADAGEPGPSLCVQKPKLWPMSILTFEPTSIFSIPDS